MIDFLTELLLKIQPFLDHLPSKLKNYVTQNVGNYFPDIFFRGNARVVVKSHTMNMSCRNMDSTVWWGSLSVYFGMLHGGSRHFSTMLSPEVSVGLNCFVPGFYRTCSSCEIIRQYAHSREATTTTTTNDISFTQWHIITSLKTSALSLFLFFVFQVSARYYSAIFLSPYTGCFTTLGHNCRRWFPRSLWSKKFI